MSSPTIELFLLLDSGIKASDGIFLIASHGAAAVKDEHDFSDIILHSELPPRKNVIARLIYLTITL